MSALEAWTDGHEKLCAERFLGIRSDVGDIKNLLKMGAALVASVVLGALGWSLKEQYRANEAQLQALQAAHSSPSAVVVNAPAAKP